MGIVLKKIKLFSQKKKKMFLALYYFVRAIFEFDPSKDLLIN